MTSSQRKTFQNLLKEYSKQNRWDLSLDFVIKELAEAAGKDISFEDVSCLLNEFAENKFPINEPSLKESGSYFRQIP